MFPFTRQQFFEVFAAYNAANCPAAIAAYPLSLLALLIAWRGRPNAGRWVGAILALMWGWVGLVYQGLYFSQINPAARVFAGGFLIEALLFAVHALLGRGLEFGPRSRLRALAGAALIVYAMVGYPLIGLLAGELYPAMPLFGVTPCPSSSSPSGSWFGPAARAGGCGSFRFSGARSGAAPPSSCRFPRTGRCPSPQSRRCLSSCSTANRRPWPQPSFRRAGGGGQSAERSLSWHATPAARLPLRG